MTIKKRKAVALISGGLDSMLAAKLMLEQNIHVEGINFYTGFCIEGHTQAIRRQDANKPKRNNALWVAEQLGIKLHIIDIIDDYKRIVLNPQYGYGANLNPCLDCKIFMVNQAKLWLEQHDFDFIITGEVVGQRPKSQRRATMPIVSKKSQACDRLLRPLCAQHLPITMPEREGWVDRTKLLAINGRGRKPQIALAARYGFDDYAQPAGGCCFLTNKSYSSKLKDLWQARKRRDYELDDIILLKVGRHLRPKANFKLIIAREEGESNFLMGYKQQFDHMMCLSHPGPLVLIDGQLLAEDRELAARIVARFCQGRHADKVNIQLTQRGGCSYLLPVKPFLEQDIAKSWYV